MEKPFPEVEEALGRGREVSLESFPTGVSGTFEFSHRSLKSGGAKINGWLRAAGAGEGGQGQLVGRDKRGTNPLA